MEWIAEENIKQEEPIEFYLISSLSDGQLSEAYDKHSNAVDSTEPIWQTHIKPEPVESIEPGNPIEFVKLEAYQPDKQTKSFKHNFSLIDENFGDKKPSIRVHNVCTKEGIASKGPPYTCHACSLAFPLKKSLKAHLRIHEGKSLQCDVCKKFFRRRSNIFEHMKIHRDPKHRCPICSKAFPVRRSLVYHLLIHQEKNFECDICSKRFRQKANIAEHMLVHIQRPRNFHCEICSMTYCQQRRLNRHMKYAHSTAVRLRYRCPNTLCDKSYSCISSFKSHACVNGIRPEHLIYQVCTICDKRFLSKNLLNRHKRRVHVRKPENFSCNLCSKTFIYRYYSTFVLHVAQNCTNKISYTCAYCLGVVRSKTKLIQHFVNKHKIVVNRSDVLQCPHCSQVFFQKNNLENHLKKNHLVLKCDHCNKTFRSRKGQSLHLKQCIPTKTFHKYSKDIDGSDHETEHECVICNCSFISKANFLEHMAKVHLETNPQWRKDDRKTAKNLCLMCNQSFASLSTLWKHQRQVHKMNENLKCGKCNGQFFEENVYLNHLTNCMKHELKRYQCTVCAKIYTSNSSLRRHVGRVHFHISEQFTCDICDRRFNLKRSLLRHLKIGDHRTIFSCEFCKKPFKQLAAVKTHQIHCKSRRNRIDKLLT